MHHTNLTYGELIIRSLNAYPEHTAFVTSDRVWTYNQVLNEISRTMQALVEQGFVQESAVGILSPNRPEYFILTIACALLGIRYTPLHPLGSLEDQSFIIKDAGIDLLVFDPARFTERAREISESVPQVNLFSLGPGKLGDDLLSYASYLEPKVIRCTASPDDVVAIAYTGGTTGTPKGVVLTHRSVVHSIALVEAHWQWPTDIRMLLTTPISHAAGSMIAPTLLRGGTVFLNDGFDAHELLRDIEAHRINSLFLVPTMIYVLLDSPDRDRYDLSCLELIMYGASPISPSRLHEALETFGPIFSQLYGQVESSVALCVLKKEDHLVEARRSSCGKPITPSNFRIADENGHAVAAGSPGEILVRGETVMREYWNKPDETNAAFEGEWLKTGDIARQDQEGFVHIIDRAKDMIISGGFNVYPREIEDVLTSHPAVKMAAVIGVPHSKWGEAIHAFVIPDEKAEIDEQELTTLVREKKGAVHVPKRVEIVQDLPLTPIGKIDKKAVRAQFWNEQSRNVG